MSDIKYATAGLVSFWPKRRLQNGLLYQLCPFHCSMYSEFAIGPCSKCLESNKPVLAKTWEEGLHL